MSDHTKIEWTDATWNPVRGCTKISPGCTHCYAERFAERFRGVPGHPYELGFDLRLIANKLSEPLNWKKPRRIFVNSMSDLFHPDVPDEFICEVARTMMSANWHTRFAEHQLGVCKSSGTHMVGDQCGEQTLWPPANRTPPFCRCPCTLLINRALTGRTRRFRVGWNILGNRRRGKWPRCEANGKAVGSFCQAAVPASRRILLF